LRRARHANFGIGTPADSLRTPRFHFPDSAEAGIHSTGVGQSELFAMTGKVITLEFVVPTVLAIVLGILFSIGAVYVVDLLI
jgi:hypothetical protein